jgi:hypothetical protein
MSRATPQPTAWTTVVLIALLLSCAPIFAQEPAKPSAISPHARLMAARSIYIQHSGGSIPNDIIGDAFQGWGHYELADDPAGAELIVSIIGPVSTPSASSGPGGRNRPAVPDDVTQVRLVILDAHDHAVLWTGSEQPKPAITEKSHEDKLVDASLRLFRRFRSLIEPEPAP